MKRLGSIIAALAALYFFSPDIAYAQNPGVVQSGAVTAGNCTKWVGTGKIADAGGACGGAGGSPGGLSGQVQFNNAGAFGGLTNAQLTALIQPASATLSGAVPAWPNDVTKFFRGDGTYATIPFSTITGALAGSQLPTFTGDVTNVAAAMTVAKINGGTVPSGVADSQILVGSGPASYIFATIPNCPGGVIQYTAGSHSFACAAFPSAVTSFNTRTGAVVPATGDYPVSLGGTGTTNLTGMYNGLQAAKLSAGVISVNPGSFANQNGNASFASTQVLTADLTTGTINTGSSPFIGGMLSPGAMSTSTTTFDGTDTMLYLVSQNSSCTPSTNAGCKIALVGDNSNVYSGALAATISNGSASWTTGGPPSGFWNGTKVRLTTTGTFPTGFAANTDYFAVSETNGQNSTTFGLSATYQGTPITAGSTFTGAITVHYGVQDHLDAQFGAGTWTVQRRVHFAFRWSKVLFGGIPDFTMDPRGDSFIFTNSGSGSFNVLSSGASTTLAAIDLSSILSNLNRIVILRGSCTSTGSAGTAFVQAPGVSGQVPVCEGPVSGVTTQYANGIWLQTDSGGSIDYQITGGARLNLGIMGGMFVDPS